MSIKNKPNINSIYRVKINDSINNIDFIGRIIDLDESFVVYNIDFDILYINQCNELSKHDKEFCVQNSTPYSLCVNNDELTEIDEKDVILYKL